MKSNFQIIPAIDIQNGKCVRLTEGKFDTAIEYNSDPVKQAKVFEDQGAIFLHIVDLDGARLGSTQNFDIIEQITKETSCKVEVGGGIRTVATIKKYLNANIWQVILGSKAVNDIPFIKEVIETFGTEKITIGIDSKDGFVASSGWTEVTKKRTDELIIELEEIGVKRYIFTDISRDGKMSGANITETAKLKSLIKGEIIASGGVNSEEQINEIKKAEIDGCIIGKALYEGSVNLKRIYKTDQ